MRSKWCSLTIAVLAVAGAGACGSDDAAADPTVTVRGGTTPPTSPITGPGPDSSAPATTGPANTTTATTATTEPVVPADGLVIRWTTRWWDPMRSGYGAPGQDIAVYADGTVVGASTVNAAAQPMVWPYLTGTIPAGEVAALLDAAAAAGLLAPAEPTDGNSNMVGAPVTFVDLRTAGASFLHRVHALQSPGADDTEYLAGLRAFVGHLQDVTRAAIDPNTAPYAEPAHVAVTAVPVEPSAARAVSEWTGAIDLADAAACAVVADAATIKMLQQHLAGEQFEQGDTVYAVTAYQLIPGETTCFDATADPADPPSDPPVAGAPTIRIGTTGQRPVQPPFPGEPPDVVVFADGTVLRPTQVSFAAAPWAWPYDQGMVAASDVEALLALAAELGLLGPAEPQLPRTDIGDAPVTTFVIATESGTYTHQVEALDSPPADDPTDYYARLSEFADSVFAGAEAGVDRNGDFYQPTHWAVVSAPVPDYPGTPLEWDGPEPLADLTGCAIVTGEPWAALFGAANAGGAAFSDDGVTYQVVARVAFPGDTGC
jgi:hypothetical protein